MRTRKRILSIVLSLCLVMALLPMAALADEPSDETTSEKTYVAQIGENKYETLQAAVDVGGDITLLADVNEDITVKDNKTVTLNLNNHKITNVSGDTITVNLGSSLTITGNGTVDNKTNKKAAVFNNGTVILSGGTYDRTSETGESANISGGNSWYTICNHGTMTINAGVTVKNTGSFSSMIENGYYSYSSTNSRDGYVANTNQANPSLTINGGTFIGGLNTVKNDDGGKLTINDGTFTNTTQASVLNWNEATIEGGTFEVTASNCNAVLNGASSSSSSNINQGKLTVKGGTFNSTATPIKNNFTGGTKPSVSGGTFSSVIPTEFCADNYAPIIQANGSVVVGTPNESMIKNDDGTYYADDTAAAANNEAKIGDTYYATLAEAISAVANSDNKTITLTKDVTVVSKVVIPSGVTLDGGNHKISPADTWTTADHVLEVANATETTTIKNVTVEGSNKSGIHAYMSSDVVLENVTVNSSANAALIVNGGKVTASSLNTSGNAWGAVNVDKGGEFELKSGTLAEDAQIWSEDAGKESGSTISAAGMQTVTGIGTTLKGYTYYTTDVSKLGEATITADGKTIVYETVEAALAAATTGQTVQVIKDATLDSAATVPANVTLVVNPGVTLNTSDKLTNSGTIQNYGTITGTVTGTPVVNYLTATFVYNNGYANTTQTVTNGYAVMPDPGYRYGYTFLGWSMTYNYNYNYWNYNYYYSLYQVGQYVPITASTTFYAIWQPAASSTTNVSIPATVGGTVTANSYNATAGTTVVLTPVPNKGYELASLTVTDANGWQVTLTRNYNGTYSFVMPNSHVTVSATFKAAAQTWVNPYTDVAETAWYYDAVKYVTENGLMNGITGSTFGPYTATTRGMLVTILYRLEGEPAFGAASFTDVAPSQYYAKAIAWASACRIVEGYGNNIFQPDKSITREEMATILYRYASYKGYNMTARADLSVYSDNGAVSSYAVDAMRWANAQELITGVTNTTLVPQGDAVRAMVATILMRFCENVVK